MRYILLINGPLCSGKTSLVKIFLKNEKRLFRASFDALKREVSDFDGEKDRLLVKDLLFSLSESVMQRELSLVVEGSASIMVEMREYYSKLAEKESALFFEVNLEAPIEVLLERLRKRVQEGKTLTVTEPEQLLYRYDLYVDKKDQRAFTYDSSDMSPEEIYHAVKKDTIEMTNK